MYIYIHICMYVCIYVYMYICMYVCMYVCMYIYVLFYLAIFELKSGATGWWCDAADAMACVAMWDLKYSTTHPQKY